jgi:extracellular factor (EF) 3-hydroxypalmitic acid methyl ester biosynthesis protein
MGTAALYRLDPREELEYLLDKSLFCLARAADSVEPALDELIHGLGAAGATAATWKRHPLFRLLDQDPFTRRARSRHSGDAVAMDFVFRGLPHRQRRLTTRVGQAIFEYTAELSGVARGIRTRRDGIAKSIDAAIARVGTPRILSVGCGHLRELSLSSAGATKLGAMYALDADPTCLEVVREEHTHVRALQTVHATVRDVLKATISFERLDLIYAANLFESLAEPVARALLARLVEMLAPGGKLLVANLTPTVPNLGLLDGVMEWSIVWRTEEQLASLVDGTHADRIECLTTYADVDETIAYLDVVRR